VELASIGQRGLVALMCGTGLDRAASLVTLMCGTGLDRAAGVSGADVWNWP
jgi:hypothetical protein